MMPKVAGLLSVFVMKDLFLAQVATAPDWIAPLSSIGVAGVMLAWFMYRDAKQSTTREQREAATEFRLIGIENASNRTTRAILMLVMTLNKADRSPRGETVKTEAMVIHGEIEESEKNRARERRE